MKAFIVKSYGKKEKINLADWEETNKALSYIKNFQSTGKVVNKINRLSFS